MGCNPITDDEAPGLWLAADGWHGCYPTDDEADGRAMTAEKCILRTIADRNRRLRFLTVGCSRSRITV